MFVRQKPAGRYKYLQVVESFREDGKVKQKVVCTLGRLDRLQAEGNIDGLVKSLSRFALEVRLVEGHKSGRLRAGRVVRIGPAIVVERLWRELGIGRVIEGELRDRRYGFSVERAFRTVKSVLETRPIYDKRDETILGHVFASFLALVVMHEIDRRLAGSGLELEWEDIKQDLEALSEVEVFEGEDRYWLRTEFAGCASKVFSSLAIAAPPTVRQA